MPLLETGTTDAKRVALAELKTRPRPAIGRYVAATVAVLAALLFIWSLVVNEAIDWSDVGRYLFNPRILDGVVVTIQITVLSLLVGFSSGLIIALMRLSQSRIMQTIAVVWVWFFRAVPVLVILILVNNIALLYPELGIGLPGMPMLIGVDTKTVVSPFLAAVIAFGANEGAYASEVFRASIKSVPTGQFEAAKALGMGSVRMYTRVVLPQAMRIAVPPLSNNTINMLKGTSLVSYIGVADLLYTSQSIYAQNYLVIPLLLVACLWYLLLVSVLSVAQSLLERRLGFDRKRRQKARLAEETLSNG
ncbi:amino acid ABC transporter permease [Microbacterium atlanticum]|uniref:amino acid ABC transporter permease n=1 Tax=Microbacterium atlanticum TaxID=2782168 RepID=UPI001888A9F3|nr:amino acid ABC transporter permease [Microbacterium atlanticum]